MTSRTSSRDIILQKIRDALALDAHTDRSASRISAADGWTAIPRTYTRSATRSRGATLDLLECRLLDYDARVLRTAPIDLASSIASSLEMRGNTHLLIPPGFPDHLLPESLLVDVDRELTPRELDRFGGVITESTLAIAETGTLVLQNVPGQGRRAATLVPDYHLCIVRAEDVVETVSEAMDRLARTATLPTTFISGPSATADIEMTRVKGVHGPRFLDVLLVI